MTGEMLRRLRSTCRGADSLAEAASACLGEVQRLLQDTCGGGWGLAMALRPLEGSLVPVTRMAADAEGAEGERRLALLPLQPGEPPELWGSPLPLDQACLLCRDGDAVVALCVSRSGLPAALLVWLGQAPAASPPLLETVGAAVEAVGDLVAGVLEREAALLLAAEAAESEEKFAALSEAAFEGVALHERGQILFANRAFARILGFATAAELEGRSAMEMAAPESQALVQSKILSGASEPYEVVARAVDGRTFPGELHGRTMSYRGRTVRVTAARDITERKRVEAERDRLFGELQQALAQARRAVIVREEFLSIASHELRTPLTSLQLALQSLQPDPGSAPPAPAAIGLARETQRALEVARRQVERLCRLVDDVLDVTRLQGGRLELRVEEGVNLGMLVEDVVTRFSSELARAGCPVQLALRQDVVGSWDRSRLDQVVTNLLSNAVKYAAGTPIDISVEQVGDEAHLIVRDQGIGFSEEQLPRLFEAFERAVSSEHYGGLGLGLYIVRRLAELHGGRVRAEVGVPVGAVFHVLLPCQGAGQGATP